MPKSVDIYVLESKIGSGQFGDVFKGYSKVDGTDVAIKTIRRDKIKGNDMLMKVNLRSCWRMRFRYWRVVRIITLLDWWILRRLLIISIWFFSFVIRAIFSLKLRKERNFLLKKHSNILYRFCMLFRLLLRIKLCIEILN